MSLLFGNLVQQFVVFGGIIGKINSDPGAKAQLPAAAASFRHVAAQDATWLVCIGETLLTCANCKFTSFQALGCLSAHTFICVFGYTPAKLMPSVFGSVTSKLSYVKISNILTKSAPERWPRVSRPIPVSVIASQRSE